jgi:urease accessory protein
MSLNGRLHLKIQVNPKGKSFISRMNYSSPLKVMKPFYLDQIGTAFLYVMDSAGGMLSKDQLYYEIRVDEGAHLYLTNASTSKIYSMPDGCAFIHNHFIVEKGASLESFPEEVMFFKESSLESFTHIQLHTDSVLAFSEIYSSGRIGYGESYQFRHVRNQFEIRINEKLAVWEQYTLDPENVEYGNLGYMDGFTHWGSLYLYANVSHAALLNEVRECLSAYQLHEFRVGCSLHPSGIITLKAIGSQYEAIKQCFHQVWTRLRPILLKEGLPHIRK